MMLTKEKVIKELKKEGLLNEVVPSKAQEVMLEVWDAGFNIINEWADGDEDLIVYTENTADSYDLYIVTDNHEGRVVWDSDVWYYSNTQEFMDRSIDAMKAGGKVWIDPYIAEEMESEIEYGFTLCYDNHYARCFEDKKNELLEASGGYDKYEEDED